jgi:predicted dehydrogenase
MKRPINVGIAGYGIVGKKRGECINKNPNMNLVAVCDQNYESPRELNDGVHSYQNYNDLLNHEIDALFVCLTNDVAAEVTIAGLENGLHVFCEKPPGQNVKQIEDVIKVEKKYPKLKLKYGFNHRYHDSVKDALSILNNGDLGKVIDLNAVYGKSKVITATGPNADWRSKREIAGGGILLDQGIHMVDLLRLFAGEFETIYSCISNEYWKYDVEDNAYALMKSEDGVIALLHSSATLWRHDFRLHITLEKGSIMLKGILSSTKSYGAETLTVAYKSDNESGDPKEKTIRYNYDPSWEDEVNEFAKAIVEDSPIISGTSEDAYKTMELVYRIYCADPIWKENYNLSYD